MAPVTRIASLIAGAARPAAVEFLDGLHVVVGPAEVQPVAVVGLDVDPLAACDAAHASGRRIRRPDRTAPATARTLDDVDAHADQVVRRRLFVESDQRVRGVGLEDAVVDRVGPARRGDGEDAAARGVLLVRGR